MQQEAVLTTEGPLLLLAGAGSGKTTVLINRIANIMRYGRGSDSREIPDTVTEEDVLFLEPVASRSGKADIACRRAIFSTMISSDSVSVRTFSREKPSSPVSRWMDSVAAVAVSAIAISSGENPVCREISAIVGSRPRAVVS